MRITRYGQMARTMIGIISMVFLWACQDSKPEKGSEPESIASKQTAIQASSLRAPAAPVMELQSDGPGGLTLQLYPGNVQVGAMSTHGRLFSTLDCPECGWTNELGRPRLPAYRRMIEVPAGMTPAVTFDAKSRSIYKLAELGAGQAIFPVQRPVVKLPGAADSVPFEMDQEMYRADAFYPSKDVTLAGPFEIRGHRLYFVEYYPVRYNPNRAEIQTAPGATLRIDFVKGTSSAPIADPVVRRSPIYDTWLRNNVLNFRAPLVSKGTSTDKYAEGILVVVGNAYASDSNLAAYIELRRSEGHKVEVAAMSDIGTTPLNVRNYIRGQYLSWTAPALSYVVLVGDVADVPVYFGSGGDNNQATDLYYASIDPDNYASDLLAPDLIVSRISVNDAAELSTYLTRATRYVNADFPTSTDWMRKWSLLASCDRNTVTEGTHNYVIDTYTAPAGFTGTYPANPQLGGDKLYCAQGDVSESVIQANLGDGRVVINMSGHGSETYWADPNFTQAYLNQIVHPDASPYVISNACITGTFARQGGDCWGEMWLGKTTGGAILFFGSSNNSYWNEDDILERRLWDGVFVNGITRLGNINQNAKMQTLANYGAVPTMEYYFEMYNDLGDGTVDLYTDVPFEVMATYQEQIPLGLDTIDFSVTNGGSPVQGALVSVRGDVVQQVGVTDAAGQVSIVMNPPPADVGNLQVTITGHNLHRFTGVVEVIPSAGPYLTHASHEITSDGTTPIAPTPGIHVVLPISLRNIGNDPAAGITATLTTTSSAANITVANPTFNDVAPGATGRSATHAELDILPGASDGALIDLRLDWSTQGGSNGKTRFNVVVQRPRFAYVAHTVDDSQGGCDMDGIADSAEPTAFAVTIVNQGSGDATGVEVALSASDCAVNGPIAIGNVPAGQQATADFIVNGNASLACPAIDAPFTVQISASELPTPDSVSFTETMNGDLATSNYTDDMEGTAPNGWTHAATSGTDDWQYVNSSAHSPTHAWWCSNPTTNSDKYLQTPAIDIGDTAGLSFWHRVSTESGYDGGRIEISTNNGASFSDLGSFITQNGYNGNISGGNTGWTGTVDWQEVLVDLSTFGPAAIIIRFHFTSDSSQAEDGWWIDDFLVNAETLVCQHQMCDGTNRPPIANAGQDQSVAAGSQVQLDASASSDPDLDTLTFTWSQTSGTSVDLSDVNAMNPTFTAPVESGQSVLVFGLEVSDGVEARSDSVTVTVWNCDDGNECTTDVFNGTACTNTAKSDCALCGTDGVCMNGACQAGGQTNPTTCDDNNACTQTDLCQSGACVGSNPVVCTALDSCHKVGVCSTTTGQCSNPLQPNGTTCDDQNACTQKDTCRSGSCVGANPVQCTALDSCHVAGTCDTQTGECSNPPAEDGKTCDDGSACTRVDSCQAGVCTGSDPVVCEALDDCNPAGTCDPSTGTCDQPVAQDGTSCDDGNGCTQTDTCQAGVCTGGNPVVCQAQDSCHLAGTCNSSTGLCSNPVASDGSICNDKNPCTTVDSCKAGVCVGTSPIQCVALDECHETGTCNSATGACSSPELPDGTECSIGTCKAGVCEKPEESGCGCSNTQDASFSGIGLLALVLVGLSQRKRRAHSA